MKLGLDFEKQKDRHVYKDIKKIVVKFEEIHQGMLYEEFYIVTF